MKQIRILRLSPWGEIPKAVAGMRRILSPFSPLLALIAVGFIPAMASTVYIVPPEAPAYLINPSAPGVDTLEAFIQTAGMSFASPGFVNLDSGWKDVDVSPKYSLEYGTLSAYLTEDLAIIGSSASFTVDFYAFTGCATLQPVSACPVGDLTDAYTAYINGGSYAGYTPLTVANLSSENSTSDTPEPATTVLIGLGLIGLAVRRYHKR